MMRKNRGTLEEQVALLRGYGTTCTPRELSQAIGGQPYYYNMAARNGTLGFEFTWHGRCLRIYTESVIKKLTGG